MRAAVLRTPGTGLELTEVPTPEPGPGEARVRVIACGFCHTDLHYLDHGVPTAKAPPIILGHEIAGRVDALGPAADGVAEGATVLVPAVLPCGRCELCRTGRENICPKMRMVGNHIDGGFAEYLVVPAKDLVPLPPEIDPVTGCIIADALTTPYHAVVHRAAVREGERVVVIGCGGVGINLVQFAAGAGAQVFAIDLNEAKLRIARELGATETLCPEPGADLAQEVRRRWGDGVDVAFEAVGSPATIALAFSTLRRGGRLCLVGYSSAPAVLPAPKVMFHEQTIVGSLGCRPADYARVVDLVRVGRIRLDPVVTGRVGLDAIATAAERLRRGEGLRTVVRP
ncbi:MAG: zinc-binding dehydrogenase [Thermoplasmata archaeon]